ncbi:MAG: porin family protein [Muribaculaceae bacterium]
MKSSIRIIVLAMVAMIIALPASAQFRFGIKAGVALNSLHFDKNYTDVLSSENRAGFTGGLMAEFTVPVIGLGLDASLMYVHRSADEVAEAGDIKAEATLAKRDYIEIPINVKYKFSIPAISSIISPYVFTGPSIAFLVSDAKDIYNKCDVAWNVGAGVELIRHLQVSASYGFGITKLVTDHDANVKNRYWTLTAAYLF